jgi:hypothetical protein
MGTKEKYDELNSKREKLNSDLSYLAAQEALKVQKIEAIKKSLEDLGCSTEDPSAQIKVLEEKEAENLKKIGEELKSFEDSLIECEKSGGINV